MKPISGSRVYLKVNRTGSDVVAAAQSVTVSDVHESMGSEGRVSLMSSRMRPRQEGARIAGPAVTAFCAHGDNLMMHRALYLAQPGDVLVVVCQSETSGAQWGDLAARYAKQKGLAGVVVQGCVRDVDAVRALGFPVWSTHVSPMHPDKKGHGLVNAPVVCDGVRVCPGDLVVADGDGVQVVPRAIAPAVIAAAVEKMKKENAVGEQIDAGGTPWHLHGADKIYATMDIEEFDGAFDDR